MTLSHYLTEARSILAEPEVWGTEASARSGLDGVICSALDEAARIFDIVGAMEKATGLGLENYIPVTDEDQLHPYLKPLHQAMKRLWPDFNNLAVWNDALGRTHSDIMTLFTEAMTIEAENERSGRRETTA